MFSKAKCIQSTINSILVHLLFTMPYSFEAQYGRMQGLRTTLPATPEQLPVSGYSMCYEPATATIVAFDHISQTISFLPDPADTTTIPASGSATATNTAVHASLSQHGLDAIGPETNKTTVRSSQNRLIASGRNISTCHPLHHQVTAVSIDVNINGSGASSGANGSSHQGRNVTQVARSAYVLTATGTGLVVTGHPDGTIRVGIRGGGEWWGW